MPEQTLRNLISGIAVLVAVIAGVAMSGNSMAAGGESSPPQSANAARASEPGFTGTFLYRNDNFRTGQNLAESVLTPATVTPSKFGLLFADTIDAAAYAQPLYVPGVQIPNQGTHNVVYVATENDSVYAFDADVQGPPLWHTSFINPQANPPITAVPSSDLGGCKDLTPIIGITATPVIDLTIGNNGTLYVVSKVKLGPGSYQQQLHALDITTGLEEKPNSPVTITASAPGTASDAVNGIITFNPLLQHDRPALTISNGVVYLSFASHCDITPYHGWILGYDETSLTQEVVYNTTPNGSDGGIWESGCGPGVDNNGDLITITGNGTFDTGSSPINYGDSFIRLTPDSGTMTVSSSFTPMNEMTLSDDDLDMGSGGNLLLPDQPGPHAHLMVGAGKLGSIYLVNRDSMGGFNATTDPMVQELLSEVGAMFSTPAYWQGTIPGVGLQNMIYTVGVGDHPKMFALANGMIQTPPASVAQNYNFAYPGASPVISANGTTGGILWLIDTAAYGSSGAAILYAFDATNLSNELYDSGQFGSDNPGPAIKFTVPTVANGSVYVGTGTQLAVFGLIPGGRGNPTTTMTVTGSLAFGNVAVGQTVSKNLTVHNTGKSKLIISGTTPSDPEYASSGTGTCGPIPVTLASKGSCTFGVSFTPSGAGAHGASIALLDNAITSPQNIALTGTGLVDLTLSKASLVFGSVKFKVKPVLSFGVTNHQTQSVTLSEAFGGTNAADFSIASTSTCKASLGALKACSIIVSFAPGALGTESAMLTVSDSPDPMSPHTVSLSTGPTIPATVTPATFAYGTLTAKVLTKTLKATVTNLSGFSLPLSASISGTNASDFAVTGSGTCGASAAPNSSCTIAVTFTPTAGGAAESASMAVTVGSDPTSPHNISLTGTGH
jgi:Abnormal spindle-like microcephaly-assoc'd, ASPM-SPD-2-Hydin